MFVIVLSDYLVLMRMQALKYDNYEEGCYYEILNGPLDFDEQLQWYKDFHTFMVINMVDYPITFLYYSANMLYFDQMHDAQPKLFHNPKYHKQFLAIVFPLLSVNLIFGFTLAYGDL